MASCDQFGTVSVILAVTATGYFHYSVMGYNNLTRGASHCVLVGWHHAFSHGQIRNVVRCEIIGVGYPQLRSRHSALCVPNAADSQPGVATSSCRRLPVQNGRRRKKFAHQKRHFAHSDSPRFIENPQPYLLKLHLQWSRGETTYARSTSRSKHMR